LTSSVWYVLPDGDTYRSLSSSGVDPGVFLDLAELFREGNAIGRNWNPPEVHLWQEAGEEGKPIGHFPAFAGFFVVDQEALEILNPVVQSTLIEVLPLPCSISRLFVLNIQKVNCIDHSRAQFEYFSSGRIMRVKRFAFIQASLDGKHLFRLSEESFAKVFADDVFKNAVENNELHGLKFFALDQI